MIYNMSDNKTKDKVQLIQPILGNTLVFFDTNFFKTYKYKSDLHNDILDYSKNGRLNIATSSLCLEEWRSQKIQDLNNKLRTYQSEWVHRLHSDGGENIFIDKLIKNKLSEFIADKFSSDKIIKESKEFIENLISSNNIHIFPTREEHIEKTWNNYFQGNVPFKDRKNKQDIPDAWIFEAAKDALSHIDFKNKRNKIFIGTDGALNDASLTLGFIKMPLAELVESIKQEEYTKHNTNLSSKNEITIAANQEASPLNNLLSKALTQEQQEIWLRLLGITYALKNPTHDSLTETIAEALNSEKETISIQAKYLASASYLQDTGNHYIIKNENIGKEASAKVINDILKILGLDNEEL